VQGILLFAVVLSVLIVVHEWGHYFAAKRLGIRVERFSIGFGPVLFRLKPRETEFCVSLIPLGGYVKLAGEGPEDSKGEPWEFHTRPNHHKFLVVFAGPLLNAILAFFIFFAVYVIGQPVLTSQVGEVMEDYPAQQAGLLTGDRIIRVNGEDVRLWEDLLMQIHANKDGSFVLDVEREDRVIGLDLTPRMVKAKDIFGKERTVPRIGVMPSGETVVVKSSFFESFRLAALKVVILTKLILTALGLVVTGAMSFKESMAGPIGIYVMTQQAAQVGIVTLLDFVGRLSVSLFIINLLPIPVLDGGHLFFIGVESILRRPVSDRVKDIAMRLGLAFILALTIFVIYQDILKFGIWSHILSFIGIQ